MKIRTLASNIQGQLNPSPRLLEPALPPIIPPPTTEAELIARSRRLAGRTLAELAAPLEIAVPEDQRRAKGWVGNLLEKSLGATASSRPVPDFELIGVELKTLPVDTRGTPKESTFVATLDLGDPAALVWETSSVRKKLARVLWVPVEADKTLPFGQRRVGVALLWSPSASEEAALRKDFEEIADLIDSGFVEKITAHRGTWLQLRPKGANGKALRWAVDADGVVVKTHPRGFYLRAAFTGLLLQKSYILPK